MLTIKGSLDHALTNPAKKINFDDWSARFYPNVPGGIFRSLENRTENPYVLWDSIPVTQQMCDEIRLAGTRIHKMIRAGLTRLMEADRLLLNEYAFPEAYTALGLADVVPIGDMRIDLSINAEAYENAIKYGGKILPNHIKAIEWNCECPSFMWESGHGQNLINQALGRISPNMVGRDWSLQMGIDFHEYVKIICKERKIDLPKTPLYFTYLGDEDNNWVHEDNLSFFERMAQYESASGNPAIFRYFQDLILDADGDIKGMLDAQTDTQIKLLFSHVPYPTLLNDSDTLELGEYGTQLDISSVTRPSYWDCLVKALLEKEVTKFPGTQASYAQNKAFYAFLYESMLEGEFDGDEDLIQTIKDHLLPTSCTPEFLHQHNMWLNQTIYEKPVNGNEGRGIYAYLTDAHDPEKYEMILDSYKESDESDKWYDEQNAIYQHQGDLPEIHYLNEDGTVNGKLKLMLSVYVSALGQGCLIAGRAHTRSEVTAINPESGIWVPLSIQEWFFKL